MPVNENMPLVEQLKQLGFEDAVKDVKMFIKIKSFEFSVPVIKKLGDDKLMYQLDFESAGNDIRLKNYKLTLQSIAIPKWDIAGMNVERLERRLMKIDKIYDNYYSKGKPASEKESKQIELSEKDIHYLFNAGGVANEIAQLIMFKYLPEDRYQQYVAHPNRLKENYQRELTVGWNNGNMLSAQEAYPKCKKQFFEAGVNEEFRQYKMADGVIETAQFEISFGREWMAYNTVQRIIDRANICFFKTKEETIGFTLDNISEYDKYNFIKVKSVKDLLEKIPYISTSENKIGIDPDRNGLYDKDGNAFTDALIDHFKTQQSSLFNKQLNANFMNQENFQYLKDNIKYMGFGEKLYPELEQRIQEGKTDFQLTATVEFSKKSFEATLNFRKSDSTDMYFFNNYHASLEKNNGEKVDHTFYLNKGKGVTAKEAFNMLDGRAVHKDMVTKDGTEYKAWLQLDLENKADKGFEVKQFHENYGYDLKAAVEKFAVAELKEPEKEKALMTSLQKGNVQSVTIEKDGESHKMFMEANPQYKNVTLYDSSMKMVAKEAIGQYQAGVEKGAKAAKEDMADDKKKDLTQTQKPDDKKLDKKNDKSLLPKKRESKSKGLGVS